jgi:hypothetical protein
MMCCGRVNRFIIHSRILKAVKRSSFSTMVGMPFIRHIPILSLSRILFLLQSRQPFNSTW